MNITKQINGESFTMPYRPKFTADPGFPFSLTLSKPFVPGSTKVYCSGLRVPPTEFTEKPSTNKLELKFKTLLGAVVLVDYLTIEEINE